MNLNIINNKNFSWLKNSEFYKNLNLDIEGDLDIKYCSIDTEDINLFLDVGHFWGVNHYPKEFFNLIFETKPVKHLKKFYDLTHSFFYSLLISLIYMSPKNLKNKMASRAVKYNYMDLLEYSEINNSRLYNIACIYDRFEIIKYLFEKKLPFHHNSMNCAAYHGRLEILRFFMKNNLLPSENTIEQVCIKGHLEILKFLHEKGCLWNKECIISAYEQGHLEILKYLYENECPSVECLLNLNTYEPNLKILKYLHEEKGCFLRQSCFRNYLKYKKWDCIKYIECKIGLPNPDSMGMPSLFGYLKIIKYFHKKGSFFDEYCLMGAISLRRFKTVKYLIENKCPGILESIQISAECGGIDILKYHHKEILKINKNFKWSKSVFEAACQGGNFECIKYILENGFVLEEELFKKLFCNKYVKLETLIFLN
uniref:Ankyrin repeat protein n=1 Tax=viral metagenome TaxID=1070528 RepID=A0A6C0AG92_9ZZZZ